MVILDRSMFWLIVVLGISLHSLAASAQVPEIANPKLPDIAMATWYTGPLPQIGMYNGPIIVFNPMITSQVGPILTAFFQAHEYCHVTRNHIQQQYFLSNPYNRAWLSQSLELEADECATEYLLSQDNIQSVRAAALWFQGQGPFHLIPSHPPGQTRAVNIINTARILGVIL